LNVGGSLVAGILAYALVVVSTQHPFVQFFMDSLFRVGDITGTGVLMIPLAYSVVMLLVAVLFGSIFSIQHEHGEHVLRSLGVSFAASVIGAAATYGALQAFGPLLPLTTFLGIFSQGALSGLLGVLIWILVLWLLRSRELGDIYTLLISKVKIS
jgi:hypothetical protein